MYRLAVSRTSQREEVRRGLARPCKLASSFVDGKDVAQLRDFFPVLQPIRKNAKRKSFRAGDCFVPRRPIGHHSRQIGNFPDPTPILFAFHFNGKVAHRLILTLGRLFDIGGGYDKGSAVPSATPRSSAPERERERNPLAAIRSWAAGHYRTTGSAWGTPAGLEQRAAKSASGRRG